MSTTTPYTTKACAVCKESSVIQVNISSLEAWESRKMTVQVAFPYFTADERELLISGTHPACWDELFGDEEE